VSTTETTPSAAAGGAPANANSLRWSEYRRLLGLPVAWISVGGLALLVLVVAAAHGQPVAGLVFGGLVALAGLGVVFWIADRNAANRFFQVYAANRGLELGGRTNLPPATPLLQKGGNRYATRTLSGQIAPGIFGTLDLFTYEETVVGAEGQTETKYHEYTIGTAELPECVAHMPELYCNRKRGLRSFEKVEDVFRRGKRRVTLESEELGKRYEIFVGKDQDEVWTRRLFSPGFIVWLAESSPKKFAFELVEGTLVAYLPDHVENAETLDTLAAATGTISRRLLDESAETTPRGDASEPSKA
jgi:hypothetical protein